ncbi:hypothetical protein MOSE0_L08988 [Monosporozyma servazzii]
MPVSKSLSKIHKNLSKKKRATGKTVTLHPNGRKFKQINRATLREAKVIERKRVFTERKSGELSRIKFMQDLINTLDQYKDHTKFNTSEIAEFIQLFINRDDEEIDDFKAKRKPNRPPHGKQLLLENKRQSEMEEFQKGFQIPDLTLEDNVKFLRKWNGSFGAMSTLKLMRVNSKGETVIN